MSYDLVVFEKTKAPIFHEDFLAWFEKQVEWSEERDYDYIEGTSPSLVSWFMEMKDTFPPLNGKFSLSDEERNADKNLEHKLTDYSIASDLIYASFGYYAAEEAELLVPQYAKKHGVGFYDPQTGKIDCDSIVFCKLSTESQDEQAAIWETIEQEILTLGSPERGTSNRNNAFIILSFENNNTDQEFMQSSPSYPKKESFFSKLFGSKQDTEKSVMTYTVEAGTGEKVYAKEVSSIQEVVTLLHAYYKERKLPNLSGWVDTGIL